MTDADGNPVITSIVTVIGEAQSDDEADEISEQIAAARDAAIAKMIAGKVEDELGRPLRRSAEEGVPAVGQQLVQRLLDGFANLVGQLEGDHRSSGADSS